MRVVRARVLQVLRDGASTSVIAQMAHSNAVLKLAVARWSQAAPDEYEVGPCLLGTNASKLHTQFPVGAGLANASKLPFGANTLKPGHEVLLRVLACAPPEVTVELAPAERGPADCEARPEASTQAPAEHEPPRKRPCLRRLP